MTVRDLEWVWEVARTGIIDGIERSSGPTRREGRKGPIVDITNGTFLLDRHQFEISPCTTESSSGESLRLRAIDRLRRDAKTLGDTSLFGAADCNIFGDGEEPRQAASPARSPTKPVRHSALTRHSTAPASPTKRQQTPLDVGPPSSSDSAPVHTERTRLSSGIAALLGKHFQDGIADDSSSAGTPPRKKARPASRAKVSD